MLGKARSVREFLTSEPRQAGARVENAPKFLFILGGSIVHPKMAQRRQSKGNSSRTCFQTTSTNCIFLSSEGNVPGGNTAPKQWVRVYHANRTSEFCGTLWGGVQPPGSQSQHSDRTRPPQGWVGGKQFPCGFMCIKCRQHADCNLKF